MTQSDLSRRRRDAFVRWGRRIALVLSVLAATLVAVNGFGYKNAWWDLKTAFYVVFPAALVMGILGAIVGVIVAVLGHKISRRSTTLAIVGLLLGAAAASVPLQVIVKARQVPPIHDISTDTIDPPQFDAILPLREGSDNPASYPGGAVATQQREAYPDISTIRVREKNLADTFAAANQALEDMGLNVVASDLAEGKIEAVATTQWFGFKDDVVVRIQDKAPLVLVDVRSKSRVGLSDLGANAARIRDFRDRLIHRLTND